MPERLADPVANLGGIWTLVDAATEALPLDTVPISLKDLNGRLAAGNWPDIPRVELLSGSGMGGDIGAWAESTQTIYLNSDCLSSASSIQVAAVLTEKFLGSFFMPLEHQDVVVCEPGLISQIVTWECVNEQYRLALNCDGWWDAGSAEFDAAESTFEVDANQDGIIGLLENLDVTVDIAQG